MLDTARKKNHEIKVAIAHCSEHQESNAVDNDFVEVKHYATTLSLKDLRLLQINEHGCAKVYKYLTAA